MDLAPVLLEAMNHIDSAADVFISTDTEVKQVGISEVFAEWAFGKVTVRVAPNRGRDIAPKLLTFRDVYDHYEIVLFLHSKQSPHLEFGHQWRDHIINCLIGSSETAASIIEIFRRRPDVGMIIPQHYPPMRQLNWIDWGENFLRSRRLAWRMNFDLSSKGYTDLPSGSMFWSRSAALHPLLELGLSLDDFQTEQGQIDSTTAHCIERLFLYVCEQAGFTWLKVSDRATAGFGDTAVSIADPEEIDRFIENCCFRLSKK